MHSAVFLDRDGTINQDVSYLSEPTRLRLLPGAAEAIRRLRAHGFLVIIVTNQSGVARGLFTEADLRRIHKRLQEELAVHGATVDAIYYCPHHPEAGMPPYRAACSCRKPATGLLEQAAKDFNVDLPRSCVVGDKASDVIMGRRAGCRTVRIVHDAHSAGGEDLPVEMEPDFIAPDLLAAVTWILDSVGTEEHV